MSDYNNIICVVFRVIGLSAYLLASNAFAVSPSPPCADVIGRVSSIDGVVEIQRARDSKWLPATLESVLCQGDSVRSAARSRAALSLVNETYLRVDERTSIRLVNIVEPKEQKSILKLIIGAIQSFSRKPRQLEIDTPYLNGVIEGTEFVFRVVGESSTVTVFEGNVRASNTYGEVDVAPGNSATAIEGRAPVGRTVVRPRDAAQWGLYYPPLVSIGSKMKADQSDSSSAALHNARRAAMDGDVGRALAILDEVPNEARESGFFFVRAALMLGVGRVDTAKKDINEALKSNPRYSQALALRAIINVAQNQNQKALADAQQAVAGNPRSSAAYIALSYAQQANFQIAAARDTLVQAAEQFTDDPLVLARLSEVWLMLGNRQRAVEIAEKAAAIAPGLSRAQITLGFSALAEYRYGRARKAFERAISLDSADPLPHLGLGLTRIATGDVEPGREEIGVAVALDSNNALLRAYLGKAYYEEKRFPLDAEQFAIAKDLDPLDPTAYLYAGIAKQTVNRPIEALRDVKASIARNDNRAAYRGRLLLDRDQAARGTSLARIYKDLGFSQLSVIQSAKSLALDPTNASAHRFLSDSYRDIRRREISRVSELYQAQLMQDVNINPVQPSLSETNLNIVNLGGPANPGFNEFTPLFQRNKAQFNVSGFAGNNDTLGGEAVGSVVFDRFSLSAGAFTFDSNGFRDNNDLQHNIFNVYAQAEITPEINIQTELRRRESDGGDLVINFDPNDFSDSLRRRFEDDSARIGLRFSPDSSSDLLLSYIYSEREEHGEVSQILPGFGELVTNTETKEDVYQIEGQYLFRREQFNLNIGGGYSKVDQDLELRQQLVGFGDFPAVSDDPEIHDYRIYSYGNVVFPGPVTWTLGMSYQSYDDETVDFGRLNPKFGVQWDVTDALRLRAAYFKVIKSALATNRVLEPTQIAGFNQFYDDANATRSTFYGIALNWRATDEVDVGGELTRRDFQQPVFVGTSAEFEERDEWFHRAFVYWTPSERWSFSAETIYDRFTSASDSFDPNLPRKVRTVSLPFRVQYFHPIGLFGGVGVTYVDQVVNRSNSPFRTLSDGDSDFTVVDISAGYRFPRRLGIASVSVQNLFDNDFKYQDDSFRIFQDEPSTGPYVPEQRIMVQLTLNF